MTQHNSPTSGAGMEPVSVDAVKAIYKEWLNQPAADEFDLIRMAWEAARTHEAAVRASLADSARSARPDVVKMRLAFKTNAYNLRGYIDSLSGDAFKGAIAALGELHESFDELGAAASLAQPADGWLPIDTCPQTGFFLVTEDTAVRALWRYEGEWESPDYPAILSEYGDLIVGDDAKRLTGGRPLVVSKGVRNPHHWRHVPEGMPQPDDEGEEA